MMQTFERLRTNIVTKMKFAQATVLTAGLITSCINTEENRYSTPYSGQIILSESGTYYQANRLLLTVKENITKTQVRDLISPYDGVISGWIRNKDKEPDWYTIDIPSDKLDLAIAGLSKKSEVGEATRNYYLFKDAYDNDIFDTYDVNKKEYICNFSRHIQLSAGLDLLKPYVSKLSPSTIAIVEVGGFQTDYDQLNFVAPKYHMNFGEDRDINTVDIGLWKYLGLANHPTIVSSIAAAKNDGKVINGVAPGFPIIPIQNGSLKILRENVLFSERANVENIVRSLRYLADIAKEIHLTVVNLSMSGQYDQSDFDYVNNHGMNDAINLLKDQGVIIIAAAGNDRKDACNSFPSALEGIIAVGGTAYDYTNNKEKRWIGDELFTAGSNYSSKSKCVTISAPAIVLQDYSHILDKPFGSYSCGSGTSASTPQVSGLVALMKSLKPDMQYEEAVSRLRAGADPIILDDDPEPTMKGQTWYRINVRKTLATLINDLENTQKVGKCTITTLPSGSHLTNFTGTHLIFSEKLESGGGIMRYAPFDSPNSKTDFPGSNILFDEANVASRDNLVVFGSYTLGTGGKYEHIFRIGKDTKPLVRKDVNWISGPFANIRLFGDTLVNGYGINLAILENIQTSTSYNLLKIPDQYLAIGLDYRLIGFYGNRYVSGISLSPTEYKYISYNGSWEQVNLPSNANCFSTNPLYAEKLACIVGSKSVLIYDFATKTSRTINLDVDYSILDLTIWNNRLAAGLTDDNVVMTDLDGKMIFNSSINNTTNRYAAFNKSVYLRDSRFVYELYGLGTTPSAVVTCKLE